MFDFTSKLIQKLSWCRCVLILHLHISAMIRVVLFFSANCFLGSQRQQISAFFFRRLQNFFNLEGSIMHFLSPILFIFPCSFSVFISNYSWTVSCTLGWVPTGRCLLGVINQPELEFRSIPYLMAYLHSH